MSRKSNNTNPYAVDYDLTDCDQEPIHIIRLLQTHACLLVVDPVNYTILHASENVNQFLGLTYQELLGSPLKDYLVLEVWEQFLTAVHQEYTADANPITIDYFGDHAIKNNRNLIVNYGGDKLLLEFEERAAAASRSTFFLQVDRSIQKIQAAKELSHIVDQAAQEIKILTGYDRVMIYQFDEQCNGTVIAEAREESLEAFLDIRYPASDIPQQARKLYLKNQIRIITDTQATPSLIHPSVDSKTGEPIDLSNSVARGVSPIHLEYLTNMGVRATMSIAIIVDGRLWGLIACHHRSPKQVDYRIRSMVRFLGSIVSGHLSLQTAHKFRQSILQGNVVRSRLFEQMSQNWDLVEGLIKGKPSILNLNQSTGAALLLDQQFHLIGETPNKEALTVLVKWLDQQNQPSVFHTRTLSLDFPPASAYAKIASGVLAVRIATTPSEYILWFRPELPQTVDWGGNPDKGMITQEERIRPRKSFAKWKEKVANTAAPWQAHEIEVAVALRNDIKDFIIRKYQEVRQLNNELLEAYQDLESFNYSVSHDLRAPLRSIKGFSEILQEDYMDKLDDYGKSALATIVGSVGKMNTFINDILEFSKMGSSEVILNQLDLSEEVTASWHLLSNAYPEHQEIELILHEPLSKIDADKRLFRHILNNLLSNAIKYTRGKPNRKIEIGSSEHKEQIRFYIKDNGIGFDMKYVDRVFALFHRLVGEDAYEGTGVGLAISKRIVEKHGGRIWVESELDIGTTFFCEFPTAS